jgi:hypothetical protein
VCERMNHCIIGGVGDGDSGEDGGDELRGAWARRRRGGSGAGAGAGDSPAAGIMGERRPLAPFLHDFMGALPHGDGIHGGGENVALVTANSWVEVSPMS